MNVAVSRVVAANRKIALSDDFCSPTLHGRGRMTNSWMLVGARVALGAEEAEKLDLEICSGRIRAISRSIEARRNARCLDLSGCLVLPGLINAHDHLEFDLFPRLIF